MLTIEEYPAFGEALAGAEGGPLVPGARLPGGGADAAVTTAAPTRRRSSRSGQGLGLGGVAGFAALDAPRSRAPTRSRTSSSRSSSTTQLPADHPLPTRRWIPGWATARSRHAGKIAAHYGSWGPWAWSRIAAQAGPASQHKSAADTAAAPADTESDKQTRPAPHWMQMHSATLLSALLVAKESLQSINHQVLDLLGKECSCTHHSALSKPPTAESSTVSLDLPVRLPPTDDDSSSPTKPSSVLHRLRAPASVTTLEPKYAILSTIAEFHCTWTSIFFAMPALLYFVVPVETVSPLMHTAMVASVITACISGVYHATLWRLFSTMDTCMATIMAYLQTLYLHSTHSPIYSRATPHPILLNPMTPILVAITITCVFVLNWENTAKLSVQCMALAFPFMVYAYLEVESPVSIVSGVIGVLCFVADRKGWARTHSLWHLFGGISLMWGMWDGWRYDNGVV